MGIFDSAMRAGKRTSGAAIGLERHGISASERRAMFDKQGGKCALCSENMELNHTDVDHIIPISLPGSTDFGLNKRLAHGSCNRSRGNKIRF